MIKGEEKTLGAGRIQTNDILNMRHAHYLVPKLLRGGLLLPFSGKEEAHEPVVEFV